MLIQNLRTQLETSESSLQIALQENKDTQCGFNHNCSRSQSSKLPVEVKAVSSQELERVGSLPDASRMENAALNSKLVAMRLERDQALRQLRERGAAEQQPIKETELPRLPRDSLPKHVPPRDAWLSGDLDLEEPATQIRGRSWETMGTTQSTATWYQEDLERIRK